MSLKKKSYILASSPFVTHVFAWGTLNPTNKSHTFTTAKWYATPFIIPISKLTLTNAVNEISDNTVLAHRCKKYWHKKSHYIISKFINTEQQRVSGFSLSPSSFFFFFYPWPAAFAVKEKEKKLHQGNYDAKEYIHCLYSVFLVLHGVTQHAVLNMYSTFTSM